MQVIHTAERFDAAGGGVTTALSDLLSSMQRCDGSYRLLTVSSPSLTACPDWVDTVPCDYTTPLRISRNLSKAFRKLPADILHTHGLWLYIHHLTAIEARRRDIPFVLTPHGMLYPRALNHSRRKKRLMSKLWFKRDIDSAAAVHVTCPLEGQYVEDWGYKGRIEVIPNTVIIPDFVETIRASRPRLIPETDAPVFGYLGRLHPLKGIENLIHAFAAADIAGARLKVMGCGTTDYELSLRKLVRQLKIDDRIDFEGYVDGNDKFTRLASLTALVVPSEFENFGMIVPEALLVGTPVLAADTTPWQILDTDNCGWWRPRDVDSLTDSLRQIASLPPDTLLRMGNNGASMVKSRFAPEVIAQKMRSLYESLV